MEGDPASGTAVGSRSAQADTAAEGRRIAEQVIAAFPGCPIPEVARLSRTLRAWKTHVLARFDTDRISNGGTEAIDLLIKKTRRLAHGFRTFAHYRLRIPAHRLRHAALPTKTNPSIDPKRLL